MDADPPPNTTPPYPQSPPPSLLYHAVPAARLDAVLRNGLSPTNRPHVHLARRADHAKNALREELSPIVLAVDAAAMHAAGLAFYASPKGTWLVDGVPAAFLTPASRPPD